MWEVNGKIFSSSLHSLLNINQGHQKLEKNWNSLISKQINFIVGYKTNYTPFDDTSYNNKKIITKNTSWLLNVFFKGDIATTFSIYNYFYVCILSTALVG